METNEREPRVRARTARSTALIAGACLLAGCAKFKSQRRLDIAPFAEQTIASVTELRANLSRDRRILTVEYVKSLEDTDTRVQARVDALERIIKQMVEYSIVVAKISKKDLTERQRIEELAEYLEGLGDAVGDDDYAANVPEPDTVAVLADVRRQETLLDAMVAAQPLVDTAARRAAKTVGELRDIAEEYEHAVSSALAANFAEVLAYRREYREERNRLLTAIGEVYAYRQGDTEALERARNGAVSEDEWPRFDLSAPGMDVPLEVHLLERYARVMDVADRLRPELDHYQALQEELDGVLERFEEDLRATWGVIFVWSRAHERMAQGVVDPAEWFDVSEAPAAVFRLAKGAL